MPFIGNQPADKFLTLEKQVFTTSATDTYTLDREVSSVNDIELFLNNVRQEPTTAYTISGTTLTLASAITSSDSMYCIYQGRSVGTQAPATGSVTNGMLAGSISTSKISNLYPYRNLIINGDMSIAQRGTSTSSVTTAGYHSVDRFRIALENAGTFTVSQSTDVPTGQGFLKSFKLACTTADASLASGDINTFEQRLEGQNLVHLKKGTSNAESVTVSFWVKTNKTGTYVFELLDNDNSRHIAKTFTVDSSSTWEKKTLTFSGDTSGTLTYDNSTAMTIRIWLSAGSDFQGGTLPSSWQSATGTNRAVGQTVNLADSTSNEWLITGMQMEVGTTASDFEFLPHDVNLVRCQRYYQQLNQNGSNGWCTFSAIRNGSADVQNIGIPLPTPLRIGNPTVTKSSSSLMQAWDGDGYHITSSGGSGNMTVPVNSGNDTPYLMLNTNGFSGLDHGGTVSWSIVLGTPSAEFDAEL